MKFRFEVQGIAKNGLRAPRYEVEFDDKYLRAGEHGNVLPRLVQKNQYDAVQAKDVVFAGVKVSRVYEVESDFSRTVMSVVHEQLKTKFEIEQAIDEVSLKTSQLSALVTELSQMHASHVIKYDQLKAQYEIDKKFNPEMGVHEGKIHEFSHLHYEATKNAAKNAWLSDIYDLVEGHTKPAHGPVRWEYR